MNTPPILWAVWHCWINIKPQKQLLANCICVVALLDQRQITQATASQLQLCLGNCRISVTLCKLSKYVESPTVHLLAMPYLFENHQMGEPSLAVNWIFIGFATLLAADFIPSPLVFMLHRYCYSYSFFTSLSKFTRFVGFKYFCGPVFV
jgi:hypothetical protein